MTDLELAEEIAALLEEIKRRDSGDMFGATMCAESLKSKLYRHADQIIAALRREHERPPSGEMVKSFLEQFKAASEERWQFLSECEREAAKYRSQGDMWGWNFHMGMSSGANQADLMYRRVYRAMLSAAEAEGRKS